jgi:hypothetical protein
MDKLRGTLVASVVQTTSRSIVVVTPSLFVVVAKSPWTSAPIIIGIETNCVFLVRLDDGAQVLEAHRLPRGEASRHAHDVDPLGQLVDRDQGDYRSRGCDGAGRGVFGGSRTDDEVLW